MSNIKVGGKVFRDVEKMSLDQLQQVRTEIILRQQAIAGEGIKLTRAKINPGAVARGSKLDAEFQGLEKRIKQVDGLAKGLAKKEITDKLNVKPKGKHLRFDCYGYSGHAQKTMADLGITYQHATPQSIADQWWFWNCENIPAELPPNLSELKLNPHEQIGNGLSKEEADKIAAYVPQITPSPART